jgi:hypothetical protein
LKKNIIPVDAAGAGRKAGNQVVMKRKCQRMSTPAWTRAEAKMEPVLRQVQP